MAANGGPRDDPRKAGFGRPREESQAAVRALDDVPSVKQVRREKFSWLSRKVLIESRNDLFAKYIHDAAQDARPRWIAAQKAAGVERRSPDFRIDHPPPDTFTCLIVGDPGEGDRSQQAVALALPKEPEASDFMIIMSDVVYAAGDVNQYVEKFYEPFAEYPHVIYALPGNHDWYDGLDGFMYHFCGAEPLPRVSHRPGSFPVREAVVRLVWRKSSRPDRPEIVGRRDSRPPYCDNPSRPPQPAPYWYLDTEHVALVAIDTGIGGTLDHEQGEWLLRVSENVKKPKVLLTGKPLYVNNKAKQCAIEWGAAAERGFETVNQVVEHEGFDYVAAIGGDIHNYQRYSIPTGDTRERIEYVVSGGAGAFMSATHAIGQATELRKPDGTSAGITEDDTTLFPLRSDSLAMYVQQFIVRAPYFLGYALVTLLAAVGLAALLWDGEDWPLWRAGVLIAGIGFLQVLYALMLPWERARRVAAFGGALFVLGALIAVFDWTVRDEVSGEVITVAVCVAPILLPAIWIAVGGWHTRYHAFTVCVLMLMVTATWLVPREDVQLGVRIAAVALGVVVLLTAVGLALGQHRRGRPARLRLVAAVSAAAVLLAVLVLLVPFGRLLGAAAVLLALLGVAYVLLVGTLPTALRLGRRFADDRELVDHAARFLAGRMGLTPTRPGAQAGEGVKPEYEKLFRRLYRRGGLWRFSPLHASTAEILDFDEPPLAKNFLELSVRRDAAGLPELVIRCWAVTGLPPGAREQVEEVAVPLARDRVAVR
jgi:hypothetical protein